MKTVLNILKWAGILLMALILIGGIIYIFLPKGPRDLMPYTDRTKQARELFVAAEYAAVTGTPWAGQPKLPWMYWNVAETPAMRRWQPC